MPTKVAATADIRSSAKRHLRGRVILVRLKECCNNTGKTTGTPEWAPSANRQAILIRYDNPMTGDDRAAVVSGLRAAVTASGLSQADFAQALGTSASRLSTYLSGGTVPSAAWFLRARRLGNALGEARRRSWLTPVPTAPAIRSALAGGDQVWGLRLILQCRDHLHAAFAAADGVQAAWEADPGSAGDDGWDRLLKATIGHEFDSWGHPAPAWTMAPVTGAWLFPSPFFTEVEVRAATPDWMAARGLFIAARDLVTA